MELTSDNSILIIEHDPFYLEWITSVFTDLGYQVRGFCQLEAGVAALYSEPPILLVMDYEFSRENWVYYYEVIQNHQHHGILPILYVINPVSVTPDLRSLALTEGFWVRGGLLAELVERAMALINLHTEPLLAINYQAHQARRMEISCLFADVRGFTAFSENHDPETVATLLNNIFDIMGRQIIAWGGTIDKYIGDSLMAVFGSKGESGHAVAALGAADAIIKNVSPELQESLVQNTLAIGIGLSTGMAVVGPIGASVRRDMTAIGSTINMASRLCAKAAPGEILVSEDMYRSIHQMAQVLSYRTLNLKGLGEQRVFSVKMGLNQLTF